MFVLLTHGWILFSRRNHQNQSQPGSSGRSNSSCPREVFPHPWNWACGEDVKGIWSLF